jgi:2-keto-4-pentenoate hydratase/2-oxohepta-3-ene-1,7-dioic acid hydratase in catechol pathway
MKPLEETPEEPMSMLTAPGAINGSFDSVIIPRDGTQLDRDSELAVVFCKLGSYVPVGDATDYIAGFCVSNDVSGRISQLHRDTRWTKGKNTTKWSPIQKERH